MNPDHTTDVGVQHPSVKDGKGKRKRGGNAPTYKGPWKYTELLKLTPSFIKLCNKEISESEFYADFTDTLIDTLHMRPDPPNTPAKVDVNRLFAAIRMYKQYKDDPEKLEEIKREAIMHIARGPCIFDSAPEGTD